VIPTHNGSVRLNASREFLALFKTDTMTMLQSTYRII